MKMGAVTIRTRNVDKSVEFYTTVLGFTLDTMSSPSLGVKMATVVNEDGAAIDFVQNDMKQPYNGSGIELTFFVKQISEAENLVHEHGLQVRSAPKTLKNGMKRMRSVDPDGVELTFIEQKK